MTDDTLKTAMLHEIGEVQAGRLLGNAWEDMLAGFGHSKVEVMLRAVRDNLADTLTTLPGLLEELRPATLHGYVGSLSNMRRTLWPRLLAAYETWAATGKPRELEILCGESQAHWIALAQRLLVLFGERGTDARPHIISAIEANTL
jgi:hypothetical protein